MAMKRCPICGEKYSDTYRECPFCEEEDAIREGEEIRRGFGQGGGRGGRQPNLITPTLVVLIIIMASLLVYLLWGDRIAAKFGGGDEPPIGNSSGNIDPVEPSPGGTVPDGGGSGNMNPPDVNTGDVPSGGNNGTMPSGAGDTPIDTPPSEPDPVMDYNTAAALPSGLTLSNTDFTRSISQGAVQLRASGGSGGYTWISQDPGIASVDSSGMVTPISSGTTNVVVTDGSKRAICIVRVTGGSGGSTPSGGGTATPSGGSGGGSLKTGSAVVVNGGNGVRVRSGPGTTYDILATIPNGGSVQVVESAGNDWYKITFSAVGGVTTTGYMKGEYLANQ